MIFSKANTRSQTLRHPGAPRVRIPGGVTLYWPTNGIGYAMEYATNLAGPVTWTPLSLVNGGFDGSQFYINLETAVGNRFFRLVSPGP